MPKQAYIKLPILITYKSRKLLELKIEALDLALGACITQEQDKQ